SADAGALESSEAAAKVEAHAKLNTRFFKLFMILFPNFTIGPETIRYAPIIAISRPNGISNCFKWIIDVYDTNACKRTRRSWI
ncbi:MAG TPA: hypothetical protein VFO33_03635, partial [Casimicrobiaceae bacterium]|nr:hypothetical protein [Casimicrobiaceae bacterium]